MLARAFPSVWNRLDGGIGSPVKNVAYLDIDWRLDRAFISIRYWIIRPDGIGQETPSFGIFWVLGWEDGILFLYSAYYKED